MLATWARFEMGPGGSSVSAGRFGVKAITDSPGFFLFLPLDTNHGRSNFSVWASVSKEHDLDPALRDSSERNHDWPFIPKGNSVPSLRLWGGWFGCGCVDVTEAQNSFPPGILLCGCAPRKTASCGSQLRALCHYPFVILTSPSWFLDSERGSSCLEEEAPSTCFYGTWWCQTHTCCGAIKHGY